MKPLDLMDFDAVIDVMRQRLINYNFSTEVVPIESALGRKMAKTLTSGFSVPGFRRSAVDGFAVKLADFQAGSCELVLRGRVEMGKPFDEPLKSGETIYVPTGGMVPEGTEAMVMQEYAVMEGGLSQGLERATGNNPSQVCNVLLKITPTMGEHVVAADEDFSEGSPLVQANTFLKAAHLGKLAAAGYSCVEVVCRPKVFILSTGNELVKPALTLKKPDMGKVYDLNTVALGALASNMGFDVVGTSWCGDDETALYEIMEGALEKADLLILSGGSSVGEKDVTLRAVKRFKHHEILLHGIRIKPGKPTLFAEVGPDCKLILGLPGHPGSAFMIMTCFGGYLAEKVWGSKPVRMPIRAVLFHDLKPITERDHLHLVSLSQTTENQKCEETSHFCSGFWEAEVLSGKSAIISRLADADGYILQRVSDVPLKKGDWVTVIEI